MIKYAIDNTGKTDFDLYAANSSYQGNLKGPETASGIAADLSDYAGQTVNVTFAVVPTTEPDSICILAHVIGVEVSEPSIHYFSRVDAINGFGPSGSTSVAYDMGSNDKTGIAHLVYNGTSTDDKKLVMAGWALVEGGIEKYVWSADGGKTWSDVILVDRDKIDDAYAGLYNYTYSKYGNDVDFSDCVANSAYQGTLGKAGGIGADLSAFAGQTVNVTFAAVPAADNDSLCILLHIEGVKVAE